MFLPMANGRPGPIEDFLTGFLASAQDQFEVGTAGRRHRHA